MKLVLFILGSVILMISDGFVVQSPPIPLFIRLGSSLILPCYVEEPLPMKRLKVEWRRTDSDILVHLFIYGESRPEEQHKDYYERAHFFDNRVGDGIFSLRLDDLRAEDKGFYRCKVYSQEASGETVVHIKDVEHLRVSGTNHAISAYAGEDVTLQCSVDTHITPKEVSWRKTNKDGDIKVILFKNNKIQPDSSDERFRDRAEFFTDEIPKGNFSLRLKSVRTEDKGVYVCHARNGRLSANTTVTIERIERLIVSGSDRLSSLSVGENVTLNCSVENYIPPEEISWWKTSKYGDIPVLVLEKTKSLSADERFRDRAEFFTDEIPKGNFSLRLKSVRTEDKGVYVCHVRNGRLSANTTVTIERLSFSGLHKVILFLCISASGSALLFWWFICCRSQNESTVKCLHICLIFVPNIMMFLAVVLWGVSEGSLYLAVACSALYLLRPNMLFRAGPYGSQVFRSEWMKSGSWTFIEYIVFTCVFYPVLFQCTVHPSLDSAFFLLSLIIGSFAIMILLGLLVFVMAPYHYWRSNYNPVLSLLPGAYFTSVYIFIFYFFAIMFLNFQALTATGVLPLLTSVIMITQTVSSYQTRTTDSCLAKRVEALFFFLPFNSFMISFYYILLKNHEDYIGWLCVTVFLQIQWTRMHLTWTFNYSVCRHNVFVYLYGSVGVVLLSASTLMTELILNILTGERTVEDLRTVLFPAESIFAFSLLILQEFNPGETLPYNGCFIPGIIILIMVFSGAFIRSIVTSV